MSDNQNGTREWHIITCEYPPRIGGVSDHTLVLASSLAASDTVHVWCPAVSGDLVKSQGVIVHQDCGHFSARDLWRLSAELDATMAPRRLFVQWVPQGFGYRSLNLLFPVWLTWRSVRRGDQLHLMVHEPFLPLAWHPVRLGMAVVQRAMLAVAGLGATRVWLSTTAWQARVGRYVRKATPIAWLPVPVPRHATPVLTSARSPRSRTIGHFGTYSRLVTPILSNAIDEVLSTTDADVLLIGHGSTEYRHEYVARHPESGARVRATGFLSADQLARHVADCDVMMQPYPDGVTTRRTSTLALLSMGTAVVTNSGHLTEPLWAASRAVHLVALPDGKLLGSATAHILADSDERGRLVTAGLRLYDEHFDSRHALAALQGAA